MTEKTLLQELRAAAPQISVGVLTADWMHLAEELALIEPVGVKLVHFDVMDGCFCPALTLGPPVIKAVQTKLYKDVHLMIEEPLEKLADYVAAGADILSINAESCAHLHRALQMMGEMDRQRPAGRGIIRGVSLNPATPVEMIRPVLDEVELVVLLAVNPGWSGQGFIGATAGKLAALHEMIRVHGKDILSCVDGGVKRSNITDIAALGADIVVTGSAVFDGRDPAGNARFMMQVLRDASQI